MGRPHDRSAVVPTVVDLFSGAGGLSNGFDQAGFDVTVGVDHSEPALETWDRNHNGESVVADLAETAPEEVISQIRRHDPDPDVVVGGPPCKDFTKLNQKVDLDRNNLTVLFGEYVARLQPEAFVLENVRYLTSKHEDVLEALVERLGDAGYTVGYRLLDAADYGVPQHRIRAFVVGFHQRFREPMFPAPTHGPDSDSNRPLVTAGEALSGIDPDVGDEYDPTTQHAHLLPDIPPGMNYSFYTEKMGHPEPEFDWRSRFSDYLYKADPEKPVRTLKAKPGAASGPFHWENRRFTEAELKRLHTFPEDFVFPHGYSETMRQIGNSVPPRQATALASAVRQQIDAEAGLIGADADLGFASRRRTGTEEYRKKARKRREELGIETATDDGSSETEEE